MKILVASTLLVCSSALMLLPCISAAQTITINSVSATNLCEGDSVSVTFTATGPWGHRNAFTLQLSDPSGSFSNGFQNVGSIVDTLPGTFTIKTRMETAGPHYRFRVLGAVPFTISGDNGSDITAGTRPWTFYQRFPGAARVGTLLTFSAAGDLNDTSDVGDKAYWDFGSGATPATATTTAGLGDLNNASVSQTVTYSTTGDKTVTLTIVKPGECSAPPESYQLHIYDCTNPIIPHDAIVIDSDKIVADDRKTYWVNPGYTFAIADRDTIFAEPGSTISGNGDYGLIYLKQGAVLNSPYGSNTVIYSNGVSINGGSFDLNCPNLDFDYSDAPPNRAVPSSGVNDVVAVKAISVMPNPASASISIDGIPQNVTNISVLNVLGREEIDIAKPKADARLDLSRLSPGIYYVRFALPGAVVTKKIVKE